MMVGFGFQKREELKYKRSSHHEGAALKKNTKTMKTCTDGACAPSRVFIYRKCVNRKPMAPSLGFTSLLRHSQEKSQAAEEEQGPHDQS